MLKWAEERPACDRTVTAGTYSYNSPVNYAKPPPRPYISASRRGAVTKMFCLDEAITSQINTDVRGNSSNLAVFKVRLGV
jgi:hypothetical protein